MVSAAIGLWLWFMRWLRAISISNRQLPRSPPAPIGFPDDARRRGLFIAGQSGSGKTSFLESLVVLDVVRRVIDPMGRGVGVIDVHGDFYRNLRARLALVVLEHPILYSLVVLIDPTSEHWVVQYNPLELGPGQLPEDRASMLADVITTIYHDARTEVVRMRRVAYYAFLALILSGRYLTDMPRLLTDRKFRHNIVRSLNHPALSRYWFTEFPTRAVDARSMVESTLNRIEPLVSNPRLAAVFDGPSTFRFRDLLDQGAVVLINAPKGVLGEGPSYLFCALLMAEIQQAALSRVDVPEGQRRPFALVCDEFANYTTDTVRQIIAESRKYRLELILAGQEVKGQLKGAALQSAVLNTIGNIICFRLGNEDALTLVQDMFSPELDQVKDFRQRWQKPFGVDWLYEEPMYRSVAEIWEMERRRITQLPDRMFLWKERGKPGVRQIRTLDVADLKDLPDAQRLPEALVRQEAAAFARFGHLRMRGMRRARMTNGTGSQDDRASNDVKHIPLWGE